MTYKRVFIDANILVDLFDANRPAYVGSKKTLEYLVRNESILLTSCDIATTVYYLTARSSDRLKALQALERIESLFDLIPFSNMQLRQALRLMEKEEEHIDLEDTIQYVLAKNQGCDLIISNDRRFVSKEIKLLSTEAFCLEARL